MSAFAQSGETETGELAGYVGGAFGGGSHGTAGASAGATLSRYFLVMLDTSYMPMGKHTLQNWPAPSEVDQSHLYTFGLDFHVRIPVKERWAPYAIAGFPLLWNSFHQTTTNALGQPVSVHYNQLNGGFETGGGLRYYIGKNWGVRPEFKVILTKQTYTRFTFGIFYTVPIDWP
jgi:hypothetical protein